LRAQQGTPRSAPAIHRPPHRSRGWTSGEGAQRTYQATAYAVATGLDGALLIYAAGEGDPSSHTVVDIGKRIETISLDLSGTPGEILTALRAVAERIRSQLPDVAVVAA
jgi:hypothetical protein